MPWTFEDGETRVYIIGNRLALYDSENDSAWLGTEEPINLREWR